MFWMKLKGRIKRSYDGMNEVKGKNEWWCRNEDAWMVLHEWEGMNEDAWMRMHEWGCTNGDAWIRGHEWGCMNERAWQIKR